MAEKPIYLDYNATTPIDPQVADAMLPYLYERFGNPSSSHAYGAEAKNDIEQARREIAGMLGCLPEEIVFTSGGSESNNMAIKGAAMAYREQGSHIITSSIEHPAVLEVCAYLEQNGFTVTYLPVDEFGRVDPDDVKNAIIPETLLISIMHANNEVGTIQPIKEIAQIAHSQKLLMHTDAAQSVGKIPVNVDELGVDMLSIAGHKLYAPKGIGVLYLRTGTSIDKLIHGASHERNLRAGTENVLEIVGLGKACSLITANLGAYADHMRELRDEFENETIARFPWAKINGHPEQRLPNTSSISFRHLEANTILAELSGVAASAGAACHADQVDVSHVLEAMHLPVDFAMGTIRFSVGRMTTREEIDRAVEKVSKVVSRIMPNSLSTVEISKDTEIRLTQYTHGMGCACKLRPQLLEQVLVEMPSPQDSRILVGTETGDDAAVFLINEETALVQTVDFFTPIVDDPYTFGAISSANSLSDIYAMGAEPLFALSVVGFPSNRLPMDVLKAILHGANDKAAEAGISIIGGHTVDDTEPKFGLAVTGRVHPKHIITNAGAQSGDRLVLTKPIGTGILTSARKQGLIGLKEMQDAVSAMVELNDLPARIMQEAGAHACTDVTGFGLLGHLLGMMKASGTTAQIQAMNVPLFEHAQDLAAGGSVPGGTKDNMAFTEPFTEYDARIPLSLRYLLNDAQTSGGLLVSLGEKAAQEFIEKMKAAGRAAWQIGVVVEKAKKFLQVTQ
jgi:cysteine desulfurase NifS/selenium donor protein